MYMWCLSTWVDVYGVHPAFVCGRSSEETAADRERHTDGHGGTDVQTKLDKDSQRESERNTTRFKG